MRSGGGEEREGRGGQGVADPDVGLGEDWTWSEGLQIECRAGCYEGVVDIL